MHGGIVGVTKVTRDFPYLARLVINHMRSQKPEFQGTSVCVSCNVQSSPHRDSYNLESTENTVIPLVLPETGGEVWMQCEDDAQVNDQPMQVMQCGHTAVQGYLKPIQKGVVLCPQRWHATAPWTGDRVVMIGYSIGGLRKLSLQARRLLHKCGMPLPRLPNGTQRNPALPSQPPKTHLGRQSSPGVCSKPNHAQRLLDKEGHAGTSSQSGRESALVVDQGPVVSSPSGADCRDRSHLDGGHRARCGEEDQCVQEEDRSTGSLDPVRGGVHNLPNHGCLEEQDLSPPHGAGSAAQWQGEHGVRQTLRDDLRAGCGGEAGVHQVVREHSGGEPRELLAPTSLRTVGTGDVKDREGDHPSSLGQSMDGRLSSQGSDAKESCGTQRSVRFRELLGAGPRNEPRSGDGARPSDEPYQGARGGTPSPSPRDDQPREPEPPNFRVKAVEGPKSTIEDTNVGHLEDPSEDAEKDLEPGIFQRLPFQTSRSIGKRYEEVMLSEFQALEGERLMLLEVGGSEGSFLVQECERVFGKGSAIQLSTWNGGDLETREGQEYIQRVIREERPRMVWFSPDHQAYSPIQRMNNRNPEQASRLQAKKECADRQYEGVSRIFRAAASHGTTCVLGSPEHCELWSQDWYQTLVRDLELYEGCCKGCQVNRRNSQGMLQCSGWGFASTDGAMVQNLSLQCDQKHAQDRPSRYPRFETMVYTSEFARRVARYLERKQTWFEVAKELQGSSEFCFAAADDQTPSAETPSEGIQDIPRETRKRIFQNLRKIHTATGHCSLQYLKANLKRRGANKDVLRCAELFQCDVCDERRRPHPRSQATLHEIVPKWHTLQCDAFSWNHPEGQAKWQSGNSC